MRALKLETLTPRRLSSNRSRTEFAVRRAPTKSASKPGQADLRSVTRSKGILTVQSDSGGSHKGLGKAYTTDWFPWRMERQFGRHQMAGDSGGVGLDLYRLSMEQTQDYALFLLDTNGRVLTWSIGAQRIKGYTSEEIIGRHFSVFYTPDAKESGWPAHELRIATHEGHFDDEGWRIRKDGSRFWANAVITALRDEKGGLVGYSKITRDLTERKAHEERLRQSEERFRLLVEGVVDYAIYMLDPDGIVTSWNAGAQHLKGYTPEEIIGSHFSRFYSPEDVDAGKPWQVLATARRTGRTAEEGWRLRKNGERFWARIVVTSLHDSAGHLRGFAKVTQDLTERRQIQDLETVAKNYS
jgi:PAS domain S-box-containing protein